jgi:selenocysteine-specific elongation factor
MTSAEWARLADRAVSVLREYHRGHPARVGMPRTELGSRLGVEQQSGDLVHRLVKEGRVVEDGGVLRLPGHTVRLSEAQRAEMESFLRGLRESPYSPPTGAAPGADLFSLLLERRDIVKVGEFYFAASAYDAMVQAVTGRLKDAGKITVGEVRDMFNTSRKYAVAFLEHLDRIKLTRRVGDERVLFR